MSMEAGAGGVRVGWEVVDGVVVSMDGSVGWGGLGGVNRSVMSVVGGRTVRTPTLVVIGHIRWGLG